MEMAIYNHRLVCVERRQAVWCVCVRVTRSKSGLLGGTAAKIVSREEKFEYFLVVHISAAVQVTAHLVPKATKRRERERVNAQVVENE